MYSTRRLLPVVPLAGLAAGLALTAGAVLPATAAPADAAAGTGPHAAVTWNGWRGVAFDSTLTAAHRALGGTIYRSSTGGGCGDLVDTRTGSLNGNTYKHPHRVGTIIAKGDVAYPLGVDATMRPARIERIVRHSDFILHSKKVDVTGHGDYTHLDTVKGPDGHTLWFGYAEGDKQPYRMGLSINHRVAMQELTINGC